MTNYENDIINLLEGETPKQKYDFLKNLLQRQAFAFSIPTHMPGYGGWGNGYVAIPKDHPFFAMDYDEIHGHYPIEVHYGLTYSNKYDPKHHPVQAEGMWIIGFDTLHSGDDMRKWPDEASVMREANNLLEQVKTFKR